MESYASSDLSLSSNNERQDSEKIIEQHGQAQVEESLEARIERLGRERPPAFKSAWSEIGFCFSVVMSQILTEYFVSGFIVLLPTLTIELEIPESSSVWPATAFSLVVASTLMVFGRLGDQHGGYIVYISGLAWLAIWSLVAGFSINALMLDFCRALQGLGAAAALPTGVMLIGSVYRPGPRKNMIFALYGSSAVIGFFTGIFFAGVIGQFANWGWFFWIGAILAVASVVSCIICISNDREERKRHKIESDWLGTVTIVTALILLVFSITQSAHVSWRVAYVPVTFAISIVLLLVSIYVEGRVAVRPLLPGDVFQVKGMVPLLVALFVLYGAAGNFLLYGTQYFEVHMGVTPLQVVAWYVPLAIVGLMLAAGEGFMLHLVPGYYLLLVSAVGAIASQLLLALVPVGGNYWAWIFPAMILCTVGIDLSITLVMVFVTTNMPLARQGLGGGLVNSTLQLGVAMCIGLSDILRSQTTDTQGDRQSLKNVFWFGVGLGGLSLILVAVWGQIPKQTSDLTADEKMELVRVASAPSPPV